MGLPIQTRAQIHYVNQIMLSFRYRPQKISFL